MEPVLRRRKAGCACALLLGSNVRGRPQCVSGISIEYAKHEFDGSKESFSNRVARMGRADQVEFDEDKESIHVVSRLFALKVPTSRSWV